MTFTSPIARAKNSGSAHHGAHHWWLQRVSAIALIPLTLYLMIATSLFFSSTPITPESWQNWLASPYIAIALISFFIIAYKHAALGLEVVVEDYIHSNISKYTMLIIIKLLSYALMLISILPILTIIL